MALEDLRILQAAEEIGDEVWAWASAWPPFAKETIGQQFVRAIDSVGANIAEMFGRFHYGEKIQFLYYARGSLYEAKFWLNSAARRELIDTAQAQSCSERLTDLARQLNIFTTRLKKQRQTGAKGSTTLRESPNLYPMPPETEELDILFDDTDLRWLHTIPNDTNT